MPPAPRRPTIDDVAASAGVSRGTVSRVLNGGRYVSAAASAAVERAVLETGYVVNSSARSLATRRSGAVALVLAESAGRLFEDPSFPVLLRSCTQALAERDLVLMLLLAGSPSERDRVLRFLRGAHVDGALLVGVRAGDPLLEEVGRSGLPVVTSGHVGEPGGGPCSVAADDRGGARAAVEHLRSRGRRRITTVAGPQDTSGGVERLAGFVDVLGPRAGAADVVAAQDWTHAAGERATTELLQRVPDLDAVVAGSDVVASGVLAALHRAGRAVPDDVAVVGFDDAPVAVQLDPPLTTVRQPLAEVGRRMVDLLAARLAGEDPRSLVLPTELVVRAST
ncbi:LacI family DNA-binding transcriptional regulator [uncultured Pseudokineococcus sp.]|uniref:LacI family DNA-binding transcriptional regulator n=1 Tax=uncultured Pseudokineococcus sp. TaxID=1642928 RepID=UPI002634DE4F|nr:LacI family DNA-binding transcriptional regulator [uncultured Pseudokineococcus sp.]